MKNNTLIEFIGGVLLSALVAFGLVHLFAPAQNPTGVVNYSGSMSNTNLYTEIASIVTDITNARNTGGTAAWDTYSSSTFNFPTLVGLGVSTSTLSSSTAGNFVSSTLGIEPTLGDICWVGTNATATAVKGVQFGCQVTATGTLTISASQATGTGAVSGWWAGGNVFVSAIVVHRGAQGGSATTTQFVIPPALITTTSTSS